MAGDIRPATSTIDLSGFLAGLPLVTVPTIKKTNPEGLIERMFPCWANSYGARHVAACFWSWLCVLDGKLHCDTCPTINLRRLAVTPTSADFLIDLTENKDTRIALEEIISILSRSLYDPLPTSPLALSLMGAFHSAIQSTTIENLTLPHPETLIREPWKEVFWSEVATVARALLAEQDLDDQAFTMQEWLDLRVLTISGNLPHLLRCVSLSITLSSQTSFHLLHTHLPKSFLASLDQNC